MERSAWPKSLSSSRKREIQELCGQNPKKLRDAFDAHSQTGDDPRQPLFAGDLVVRVLGSFSSNTQSRSSGSESYEVFHVPSNAFVSSEVSKGSESVKCPVHRFPVENAKPPVQRSPVERGANALVSSEVSKGSESVKCPVQRSPVENAKPPVQRSPVESVKPPVQRSPVPILCEQSLVEAATAIYEGRVDVASEILTRLSGVPNRMSNSKQKLMGYMLSALKSRVRPVYYPPPVAELFTEEHLLSARSLYDLSRCFRLGFMAANRTILDAASEQPSTNKLHVIDFDIAWEKQYRNLLHALFISQAGNQSTLKITTLADSINSEDRLRMLGDRLSAVAAKKGVRLVFKIVRQKLSELSRDSLGCEPDEVLTVNLAFKLYRMPDESMPVENTRDELLRCVKGLAPRVVTLVEQEMNENAAPLPRRVGEALAYYGALLESFEDTVPRYPLDRARAEKGLSRKLGNWVACEGRDRVERCEVFGEWRARMGRAGFKLRPVGPHVAESMKVGLHNWPFTWHPRLMVKEENGGLCFGWDSRTLIVASAWC